MEFIFCNSKKDAIIAYLIYVWHQKGGSYNLGRTILQKLSYFTKARGVPLSYNFDLFHYGPYSQDLYFEGIFNDLTLVGENEVFYFILDFFCRITVIFKIPFFLKESPRILGDFSHELVATLSIRNIL